MVATALILLSPIQSPHPLTLLGGLSLLKRALLMAQRAGAKTCYVFANSDQEELRRSLQGDKRLTSTVIWITTSHPQTPSPGLRPPSPSRGEGKGEGEKTGHCLLFQVNTLFHPALVRDLGQKAAAGETLRLRSGQAWGINGENNTYALALFPSARLVTALATLMRGENPLAIGTGILAEQEIKISPLAGHFLYQVTAPASVGQAEKALLLSLENPRDGLVDVYINRKLSRPLTRLLVRTWLTPNQITLISCLIGLIGAACFFAGGYLGPVLGAFLLQFSAVVDCVDGEVARVKFMESPLGEWLDITLDTVVHVAIFLGIGVAVWKQGGIAYAPLLGGILAFGALLSFPLVTLAEKTEEIGKQRGGWEDQLVQQIVSGLASRDYSVIVLLSAIVGRLNWFLWGAAIGVQVFWLTLAGLLFKSGRLKRAKIFLRRPNA